MTCCDLVVAFLLYDFDVTTVMQYDKSSLLAAWRFAGRPQQGAPNGPDASWQLAMHRPRER